MSIHVEVRYSSTNTHLSKSTPVHMFISVNVSTCVR